MQRPQLASAPYVNGPVPASRGLFFLAIDLWDRVLYLRQIRTCRVQSNTNHQGQYEMRLLNHLFRSKTQKQFDRALKEGRYNDALMLCRSDKIPASSKTEAQYKRCIYQAISEVSFNKSFHDSVHQVAAGLQDQGVIQALPDAEQTATHLAHVANALQTEAMEQALAYVTKIKSNEGQAQALRMVVGHMACEKQPLERMLQVIKSMPSPAFVNEELRNLLLAKLLRKDFDAVRQMLPHISQGIRRGLRPQIDFVARNLDDLEVAQQRARDLVHPDDVALTLALVAGAMGKYSQMSHFSRSVSTQLLVGTHATYAASLAYAGKSFEAVSLLENIHAHGHEYHLRLCHLAINHPLSASASDRVLQIFASADHYEGALAFWYHQVISYLVKQDIDGVCHTISMIANNNLREAVAVLTAEFTYAVKSASLCLS